MSVERRRLRLIALCASTGGIEALRRLLGALPAQTRTPLVVIQHRADDDLQLLPRVLGATCALPLADAEPLEPLRPGRVYLAPAGYHLLLDRGPRLALSADEKVCNVRPSADVFLESAADVLGPGLLAVILTGANEDGAAGLHRVRARGGLAWVQDPATAEAPEMPAAALERAGADRILSLEALPEALAQVVSRARRPRPADTSVPPSPTGAPP
ncbi:MAG TPA: chemotaxis protein CheB [Nevskiaceae bacterium]|nr:chemotaxis protein CheB [Nevskiaceae bacterium]